jgi:HPt (histidine-containing phosphotransfer) domain-containing protein
MTGGTEAGYRKVLARFYKDTAEWLPVFSTFPDEPALATFTVQAHAIKSAAGTIGAAEISKVAAALEAAGKAGDIRTILETLPAFRERLTQLIEGIGKVLEEKDGEAEAESGGKEDLTAPLSALWVALEAKNMKEIDRLLNEIEQLPLDTQTRERINALSDKVLMGEYGEAVKAVNILLAGKED